MTSVCKSIKPANPAARAPRATRSKFALQASARKLRFLGLFELIAGALSEPRPSWLQVTKAQVRRRPARASVVRCLRDLSYLGKPNYLAAALSRLSEDSNLVDPASSHMLVSKIKPCMSKYKWYTMKLRMAH